MRSLNDLQAHALDLLVDGPSSFAALFMALRRHWGHRTADVDDVLEVLNRLNDDGLVESRQMEPDGTLRVPNAADLTRARLEYSLLLPVATAAEVSVDEVGLWYEITEAGREAWSAWGEPRLKDGSRWTLELVSSQMAR